MPEFCDSCNIRVSPQDPLRITRGGKVYHSTCYNKPQKPAHKQPQPEVVTVWHGVGTFDKRNLN